MLQRVLNEDYQVKFRDYGTIKIPKGTMVDYKGKQDPHIRHCLVADFGWIEENYPELSKKMKTDAMKYGILIPKEKLMLALRVRFIYDDCGNCLDIYKDAYGAKRYCRMLSHIKDKVQWLTITDDWDEPDCPLRSDMLIQMVDRDYKVVITGQQIKIDDEYAIDKILPFSWEKPTIEEHRRLKDLIYNLQGDATK